MLTYCLRNLRERADKLVGRLVRKSLTFHAREKKLSWTYILVLRLSALFTPGYRFFPVRSEYDLTVSAWALKNACRYEVRAPSLVCKASIMHKGVFQPIMARQIKEVIASPLSSCLLKAKRIYIPDYYTRHPQAIAADGEFLVWHSAAGKGIVYEKASVLIDKGIRVFGAGSANWYHWLVEILPAVFFSRYLPKEFDEHPLVVPKAAWDISQMRDSIELLRGNRAVRLIDSTCCMFKELVLIDKIVEEPFNLRCGYWPKPKDYSYHPAAMQEYRQELIQKVGSASGSPDRRVYLARGNDRRSYNQEELVDIASRYGFESVLTEQMSFREQVKMFSSARFIVGPSGAAFANAIFCREECRLLSWLLPECMGFCSFANICEALGMEIRYLASRATTPVESTFDVYSGSYEVDAAEFEASLRRMLRTDSY